MNDHRPHWSYWLISAIAFVWFALAAVNLIANTFASGVEPLPALATAIIAGVTLAGLLGAILLLTRDRQAWWLFLVCLIGSIVLLVTFQLPFLSSSSALNLENLAFIVLFQLAVPGFLLYFARSNRHSMREPLAKREDTWNDREAFQSEPSYTPPASGGAAGFFVFDYDAMDSFYGFEAFRAIHKALQGAPGICAFHDGDIFNLENVRILARQAKVLMPSSSDSPLADLDSQFSFGAYFAAMFADNVRNFERIHRSLVVDKTDGYLGYMMLTEELQADAVVDLFVEQLSLPSGMVIRNGAIDPGTDKFGIASSV